MKSGIEIIQAERWTQIHVKGFTIDHDKVHAPKEVWQESKLELAAHAYEYAALDQLDQDRIRPGRNLDVAHAPWPWDEAWWKPGTPKRMLTKAGALYLAEADRVRANKWKQIAFQSHAVRCGRLIDQIGGV